MKNFIFLNMPGRPPFTDMTPYTNMPGRQPFTDMPPFTNMPGRQLRPYSGPDSYSN